jgi:hypothetical protein
VCIPAVSPCRRQHHRDAVDRPCAIGGTWHAAACSSVLKCICAALYTVAENRSLSLQSALIPGLRTGYARAYCRQPPYMLTSYIGPLFFCMDLPCRVDWSCCNQDNPLLHYSSPLEVMLMWSVASNFTIYITWFTSQSRIQASRAYKQVAHTSKSRIQASRAPH